MRSLFVDNVILNGTRTTLYCVDGMIADIGGQHDADETLDGQGCILLPPLLNAHTHSAMSLFRGNGDDLPLMEWLTTRVWPYEQNIAKEEIYWGTRLSILEMIRSGCVYFNDMYWDLHIAAKAVEETGVRAKIAAIFFDFNDPAKAKEQKAGVERLFGEIDSYSSRLSFSIGPHAIYTVSKESMQWAAEFSRDRGCSFHTHLSETEKEVQDCYNQHGCSPVEYLESLGALSERTIAAHTVWLSDRDIEILGERKVVCAHNPVSNMKLAVGGVYPYRKLKKAGAVTALATDGAGSNNNLDMFEEMKIAALLQKFHDNDPTALPATEAWAMATEYPARAFGLSGAEIKVGREADFILVSPNRIEMNPPHDLVSHLVYAANGSIVDSVVCDGRVLMEHREIEGEEEIIAKANEAARSMFARVDEAT